MATCWVVLKGIAKTGVAIPRRFEAGNLYESHLEIPGSTVRGAFAAVFLQRGNASASIPQWFETPTIRFSPLRPVPMEGEVSDGLAVLPVPRSARSCKYDAGLPEGGHGVYDLLLKVAQPPSKEHEELVCPECHAPIEPLDTPWLLANFVTKYGRDYKPDLRLATHVGIGAIGTEEMNTAMEGRLFSLQCFPAGTEFRGWIAVRGNDEEKAREKAEALLKAIGFERNTSGQWQLENLRVGRRSSTYGALKVTAWVQDKSPWQESHRTFEERWKAYQEQLPETLSMEKAKDNFFFSITLVTETILLDEFLRPYRVLTGREVERRLGLEEGSVRLLACFARPQIVGGWHTAHHLPKERDMAIAAGSVFLFSVSRNKVDEKTLKEALQRWEEEGIGWRRSEGFGQVLICDPWHLSQSMVCLRWKKEHKEEKVKGLDERVASFLQRHERELKRSGLTSSQLNYLQSYANILDRLQRLEAVKNPNERLAEYLRHQVERGIGGWVHKIEGETLAETLIEVLGLRTDQWKDVIKRVNDFVLAMRVMLEGSEKDKEFSIKQLLWEEGKR
ncbi:type III-B CRISPR module-associated Cmr3 family protein [Thermocrinis sp.]